MNGTWAVESDGLLKRFGELVAVDRIDLQIKTGEVFGLLGPNGAGKTTTLRMLCGLLKPDQGRVQLLGRPLDRKVAATCLGFCPQDLVVWDGLTLNEQLRFTGAIHGVPAAAAKERAARLLRELGLSEKADKLASTLSGGMRRRLNLALALVHEPEILVLDEPQAGLDPQSRILVRDFIKSIAGRRTVILTTHDMEEADKLSDRIAILDHGTILTEGNPEELKRRFAEGDLLEFRLEGAADPAELSMLLVHPAWRVSVLGKTVRVTARDSLACLTELRGRLAAKGLLPEEVRIRKYSLEDLFISLTGRELRE